MAPRKTTGPKEDPLSPAMKRTIYHLLGELKDVKTSEMYKNVAKRAKLGTHSVTNSLNLAYKALAPFAEDNNGNGEGSSNQGDGNTNTAAPTTPTANEKKKRAIVPKAQGKGKGKGKEVVVKNEPIDDEEGEDDTEEEVEITHEDEDEDDGDEEDPIDVQNFIHLRPSFTPINKKGKYVKREDDDGEI